MKPALRQAVRVAVAVLLLAALALAALRVARSMRRGRGAVFSLARAHRGPQAAALDLEALWPRARFTGPSAADAAQALALCPAPVRRAEGRAALIALTDGKRPVARRALHLPAGGAAELQLRVPAGAVLTLWSGARASAGGKFDMSLSLLAPGAAPAVLDARKAVFLPGVAPEEGLESEWRRAEVDLAPWAGQAVTLRFEAAFRPDPNAPPGASAHAFWASPVLWTAAPSPAPAPAGARRKAAPPGSLVWVVFESLPAPAFLGAAADDFDGLGLLAREGVEFQQVYANHVDAAEGLRRLLRSRREADPSAPALPALLRGAGRRTLLIGAPGDPSEWADAGFDEVRAAPRGAASEQPLREAARWMAEDGHRGPHFAMVFVRAPGLGQDPSPRCWLRALRLSPLSLFDRRRRRALAQAVQADGALDRLWSQKLLLGDEDRTLFVVTSLRGAALRPEPVRRAADGRLARRVLPAGLGLREEEVRAVWLMRAAALAAGRRVTAPAQLLDAAPTVAGLLGLPAPAGWEGRSFAPGGEAHAEANPRFLVEGPGGAALVLDGHYKYLRRAAAQRVKAGTRAEALTDFEPEELYDLWLDPAERRNLARRRRDLLARARRAVDEWNPERTATRLVFRGWPQVQGMVNCPGGDLWNVSVSSGELSRHGASQVSFTAADGGALSFETWPPPASFTLTLRAGGRPIPADAFIVSRLGLPLIEAERRNDWYDRGKFPWLDGLPPPAASTAPRVLFGRVPVPGGPPPRDEPAPQPRPVPAPPSAAPAPAPAAAPPAPAAPQPPAAPAPPATPAPAAPPPPAPSAGPAVAPSTAAAPGAKP